MTDHELRQLDSLFDKQFSPLNETVDEGSAAIHLELRAANTRLDLVETKTAHLPPPPRR